MRVVTHRAVESTPSPFRLLQMLWGTVLLGIGIALLLRARLGLLSLDVFHVALADRTGWTVGIAFVATQTLFLIFYLPLRIRWGVGTLTAAVVPAIICDGLIAVIPPAEHFLMRGGFLLAGTAAFAVGVAAYLGAGLGTSLGALPRDGVMVELARRKQISLGSVRVVFDVGALAIGTALLGPADAVRAGVLGPASVLLALFLGPLIMHLLPRFTLSTRPVRRFPRDGVSAA